MKISHLTLILGMSILFLPVSITGQIKCKVLVPALSGSYTGGCKNGLAHGKGIAKGMDKYSGSFRKGLPHGKGIYEWSSGEKYEGEFKKGLKHGKGKLTFECNDRDTVVDGRWSKDIFAEPVYETPLVLTKTHIKGHVFKRLGEGSSVVITFSEMNTQFVEGVFITANNGIRCELGGDLGYNLIQFPFYCTLIIPMVDSSQSLRWECTMEFVIKDPGSWLVRIYL